MHNHTNGNELCILMQIKHISLSIVEHQDSLRNRDKHQLENGLLLSYLFYDTRLKTALMCPHVLMLFALMFASLVKSSPEILGVTHSLKMLKGEY